MYYAEIINFWFTELSPSQWWLKSAELDETISRRFAAIHQRAIKGLLYQWRATAEGALAEILVLDQFSRNMYRDQPGAFAQDILALVLAQEALRRSLDQHVPVQQRHFFYLPFMHSEEALFQQESVHFFTGLGDAGALDFAEQHKVIIDRFGRFPHRNAILGRNSTDEEEVFLQQPGSSF